MAGRRWLLFATERYALPILQPLQAAMTARGDQLRWWPVGAASGLPIDADQRIASAAEAVDWQPNAVFSAANWVPHFVPGIKVQVFHGFNVEKRSDQRGHFRVRGLFDLYCTQGPATTAPFQQLAAIQGHFCVVETGWPKLDPLFATDRPARPAAAGDRPVVLFGSTFTERLSAAPLLLDEIRRLVARGDRYWLLTLHPKCSAELFQAYRQLAGPHAEFVEPEQLIRAEAQADLLLADTSSIVSELLVQGKPVVTFRNRAAKPAMIDIQDVAQLDAALHRASAPEPALRAAIDAYGQQIHPSRDGRASERVLDATLSLLSGERAAARGKPWNLWRRLQIRRELGYWRL